MTTFQLNERTVSVHSPDDAPLLWVIRDQLGLTGTKFGCGIGLCGACTVHVEGRATRSCITPLGAIAEAKVTTIEGLDPAGKHPLQTPGPSCRFGTDHAGRHAGVMGIRCASNHLPTGIIKKLDGALPPTRQSTSTAG